MKSYEVKYLTRGMSNKTVKLDGFSEYEVVKKVSKIRNFDIVLEVKEIAC